MTPPRLPPRLGVAIAVVALSFPAIFIRLAQADGLSIAFLRLAFASIILWPLAYRKVPAAWREIEPAERLRVVAAGVFLGLHLFLWITAVLKTTIASAAFLVITQPIMVAILAHFLLSERLNRWVVAALILTLGGTVLINIGDLKLKPEYLWGDLLAILGAVMAAFYLLLGRSVRRKIRLLPYVTIVYSSAALILLPICILTRAPLFSLSARSYFWCFMLTLIPTLIGHTLYNWALRYLKAYTVNASIVVEPILATTMAWFIFKEQPSAYLYPGAVLLMGALILAFRGEEA